MSGNLDNESPENTTVTLGVPSAISDNSRVTQRMLANELGIALGLVNSYLKRCVRNQCTEPLEACVANGLVSAFSALRFRLAGSRPAAVAADQFDLGGSRNRLPR